MVTKFRLQYTQFLQSAEKIPIANATTTIALDKENIGQEQILSEYSNLSSNWKVYFGDAERLMDDSERMIKTSQCRLRIASSYFRTCQLVLHYVVSRCSVINKILLTSPFDLNHRERIYKYSGSDFSPKNPRNLWFLPLSICFLEYMLFLVVHQSYVSNSLTKFQPHHTLFQVPLWNFSFKFFSQVNLFNPFVPTQMLDLQPQAEGGLYLVVRCVKCI